MIRLIARQGVLLLCVVAALTSFHGCGGGGGGNKADGGNRSGGGRARAITLKGSDTMVILGQKWAEVYMASHPGSVIQVTGGGSGTGIAALINGTTEIAQSSRTMKDTEKGQAEEKSGRKVEEHTVALDGVTVYVNNGNTVGTLSTGQLKGIYTGQITNWKEVGGSDMPIVVYGRESSSGTYVFFKEHVLGGADFAPQTQTLPGTAAVADAIGKDPKGIGYGGYAYGVGIKHVSVSKEDGGTAVEPSEATVRDGSYPLSRPLYWYTLSSPNPAAVEFLTWVMSAEGQKVVKDVGYFPIN
ncbi:MAG TPA: phosphate ABC transporter substrate-binding protein [Candidatus Eisenbacteria bacterium]